MIRRDRLANGVTQRSLDRARAAHSVPTADDAAFPPLGYWRGYVWGPMAQLVHWSLEAYDHVPKVREARLALSKQMSAMMMDQWERGRRICENFSPRANATECTGTGFYTWGALSGLIRLVDAGA